MSLCVWEKIPRYVVLPQSALSQENIDNCEGVTCPEFQQCVDLVDAHECRCPPGLTGASCDQDIDEYDYDIYDDGDNDYNDYDHGDYCDHQYIMYDKNDDVG